MVRALKECWRVLKPAGWLIDLRPISEETVLAVVQGDRMEAAGLIDNSALVSEDAVADSFLDELVSKGLFRLAKTTHFKVKQQWDSPKAFQTHTQEKWEKTILPAEVFERAERLAAQMGAESKLQLILPMRISRYEKRTSFSHINGSQELVV